MAVGIPTPARDLLASVIMGSTNGSPLPGKPVDPENWHLTLRFLGTTDEVALDRLSAGLDEEPLGGPFRLELSGMGAFPDPRRATVLWLGVAAGADRLADLAEIAEEVARDVGFDPVDRPYRPHLTLSRLRPQEDVTVLVETFPAHRIRIDVEEIGIYRSHMGGGATWYERLEAFPLQA